MHRDDPIRIESRTSRFALPNLSRSEARRQFTTSLIFMTVIVCALGAGILTNVLQSVGPLAH